MWLGVIIFTIVFAGCFVGFRHLDRVQKLSEELYDLRKRLHEEANILGASLQDTEKKLLKLSISHAAAPSTIPPYNVKIVPASDDKPAT
jgi:hypothetical protein